jgi:PKD repeat protein
MPLRALFLIVLLLIVGCSGTAPGRVPPGTATDPLAELKQQPAPEGVDAQVWEELKSALATALQGSTHTASTAPTSGASAPALLLNPGSGMLSWGHSLNGDYDQNGEVNISDLTPLGIRIGNSNGGQPFDYYSADAVVDGDSNGEINISDVTQIGVNYGRVVKNYNVYTSASEGDYPPGPAAPDTVDVLTAVPFSSATGNKATERLRFSHALVDEVGTNYYWVRPADGASVGTPSNRVDSENPGGNLPPVADVSADPQAGEEPLTVTFDATFSYDPDGEIASVDFDLDGDGTYEIAGLALELAIAEHTYTEQGSYTASVRVTDDGGASSVRSVPISLSYKSPLTVDGRDGAGSGATLVMVNGRPAIFYFIDGDDSGDDLYYVRADDSKGTSWTAPPALVAAVYEGTYLSGMEVRFLGGNPAIMYVGEPNTEDLQLIRALDEEGDDWATAVTLPVGPDYWHGDFGFEVIEGLPAVVYQTVDLSAPEGEIGEWLMYMRAADSNGTDWGTPVEIASYVDFFPTGEGILGAADGGPVVCLNDNVGNNIPRLLFYAAGDALGGTWGEEQLLREGVENQYNFRTQMLIVDGVPEIIFHDDLPTEFLNTTATYHQRALDSRGAAWAEPTIVYGPDFQAAFDFELVGGLRTVLLTFGQDLLGVVQADAAGNWGDVEAICQTDFVDIDGMNLADIGGKPAVAFGDSPGFGEEHLYYSYKRD